MPAGVEIKTTSQQTWNVKPFVFFAKPTTLWEMSSPTASPSSPVLRRDRTPTPPRRPTPIYPPNGHHRDRSPSPRRPVPNGPLPFPRTEVRDRTPSPPPRPPTIPITNSHSEDKCPHGWPRWVCCITPEWEQRLVEARKHWQYILDLVEEEEDA